jgi:hypothetical protein
MAIIKDVKLPTIKKTTPAKTTTTTTYTPPRRKDDTIDKAVKSQVSSAVRDTFAFQSPIGVKGYTTYNKPTVTGYTYNASTRRMEPTYGSVQTARRTVFGDAGTLPSLNLPTNLRGATAAQNAAAQSQWQQDVRNMQIGGASTLMGMGVAGSMIPRDWRLAQAEHISSVAAGRAGDITGSTSGMGDLRALERQQYLSGQAAITASLNNPYNYDTGNTRTGWQNAPPVKTYGWTPEQQAGYQSTVDRLRAQHLAAESSALPLRSTPLGAFAQDPSQPVVLPQPSGGGGYGGGGYGWGGGGGGGGGQGRRFAYGPVLWRI